MTSVASTSVLLQAWQDEAMQQGVALPVYLDALLGREPDRLGQVASCLGARPLSPERLRGAAPRWDLLPLAEALAVHVLPLESMEPPAWSWPIRLPGQRASACNGDSRRIGSCSR